MQRINQLAKQQMQNKKKEEAIENKTKQEAIKKVEEQNRELVSQNKKLEKENADLKFNFDKLESEVLSLKTTMVDPNQVLSSAIKEGNFGKAQDALDLLGADVNKMDSDEMTPLVSSLLNSQTELALLFLKRGANLFLSNKNYPTVLDLLCEKKDFDTACFVLDSLPKDDADAKLLLSLYDTTKSEEAKKLIANTLLFQASKQDNKDMAEKALALGANINAQDKKFMETALHKAVYSRQSDMVQFLLEKGSSCNIKDRNNQTAIEVTSDKKIQEIILKFINQQATKIQASARGFFARNKYRHEVQNICGEAVSKLFQEGKYDDVDHITSALKENRLADALKLVREIQSEKETLHTPKLK